MTSPGIEAIGFSFPKTEHSISRPTIACSTRILESYWNASRKEFLNSFSFLTLFIPTEEPRFAGLINNGKPSVFVIFLNNGFSLSCKTINFATGIPASLSSRFITSLSIPIAEPSTLAPMNGTPANFKNPWILPSSPYGPWRTGKATSIFPYGFRLLISTKVPELCTTKETSLLDLLSLISRGLLLCNK